MYLYGSFVMNYKIKNDCGIRLFRDHLLEIKEKTILCLFSVMKII